MVVILYRWKIKKGFEGQFKMNWSIVTQAAASQCGSFGSRLHVNMQGEWIAYAQWPSLKARQSCVLRDDRSRMAIKLMKDSIEKAYPEMVLAVKMDHLLFPQET